MTSVSSCLLVYWLTDFQNMRFLSGSARALFLATYGTGDYFCPCSVGPRCKRLGYTLPLLRSNSPVTKLIILKYTIRCLLLYFQGCATITTRPSDSHLSKHICPTEKQNLCLVSIYYYVNCCAKNPEFWLQCFAFQVTLVHIAIH